MTKNSKAPIILLCTGLGRVQRGFEMYIAGLAQKLAGSGEFENLEVWTGGDWKSPGIKSRKISNLGRNSRLLAKRPDGFLWEQRSFALGMLPLLLAKKPAAIYLGEYQLYCYLFKIRQKLGLRFSLVLYTGGQAIPGLFNPKLDFVHHVTDYYLHECGHIPHDRQRVIPHFMDNDFEYDGSLIASMRSKAGGKKIVLSVGIIDNTVKRMDYLEKSLAQLVPGVFPVLLGDTSPDTDSIRQLLTESFGSDGFMLGKVPHKALGSYYCAADLFVICSPKESFGLASVEALWHGLPVICDDFPEVRFVLKDKAVFIPMRSQEVLTAAIRNLLSEPANDDIQDDRKLFVQNSYDWSSLRQQYLEMFRQFQKN